ncbi:MAG: argininosuccinate lyase, partial [Gammaproteobacteria bacterium]
MNHAGSQLWAKGLPLDQAVHRFTVGSDPVLDERLLPWDALGSAAHARTLAQAGLLAANDATLIAAELADIAARAERGEIRIRPEQEDCHTVIEALLTEKLGDAGKRLHLGR